MTEPMDWGVELGFVAMFMLGAFGYYVLWCAMTKPLDFDVLPQ